MDRYHSFADLAAEQVAGEDFSITLLKQTHDHVSIVAPHAGHIERGTSEFARALAAQEFNLYLFEGLRASYNYENLHITSHRFDEPQCLAMVSDSEIVICIHGCNGAENTIYLGGRDDQLISHLEKQLREIDINVVSKDHPWPGRHKQNICNRGKNQAGVQIELANSIRGGAIEVELISCLREALLKYILKC